MREGGVSALIYKTLSIDSRNLSNSRIKIKDREQCKELIKVSYCFLNQPYQILTILFSAESNICKTLTIIFLVEQN